jgi:hypothetical protein
MIIHVSGAVSVVLMACAFFVGLWEHRYPNLSAVSLIVLVLLSAAAFASGVYLDVTRG